MKKSLIISLFIAMAMQTVFGQKQELILPIPSETPSPAQLKQIERKYGMFIHFGINRMDGRFQTGLFLLPHHRGCRPMDTNSQRGGHEIRHTHYQTPRRFLPLG